VIKTNAQGLNNIVDPTHHLRTDEDKSLFACQNDFMLLVFDKKLKTDKAKEAICQHCKSEYVAQKIIADIKAHAEQGTAAKIDSQCILEYLTTVPWGLLTLHWTSGAETFVHHYKDNACTGDSLDFDKYFNLLILTAAHYDKSSTGSTGKVKGHSIYIHIHNMYLADDDDKLPTSIDSPIDSLQVFQMDSTPSSRGCNPRSCHLPPSTYLPFLASKQSTPEQHVLWDQLPNEAKEVILTTIKS